MKPNKKLLIVEDEPPLKDLLMDKFTKEGFEVMSAANGIQGLATALREQPDLILLDIIMPEMDGFAMLEKLREDEFGKKIPVIMLTNLSEPEHIARALENKVEDYFVKSHWDLDDLVKKVNEQLAKK